MPNARSICFALFLCIATSAFGADATFTITGSVVDSMSGAVLPARIYIKSEEGKWFFVKSASPSGSALEMRKTVSPTSLEMHTTISAHPFIAQLPPGHYVISAERGKEYIPAHETIVVSNAPVAVKLKLKRWIDMAALGWYSGDTHSHRPLTEMTNVLLAEDVNLGFPMTQWVTATEASPLKANKASGNIPAGEVSTVDPTHLLYPLNTEYEIFTTAGKSHTLGAILVIGHKTPFDFGVPPVTPVAEKAHREGALIDLEKHSWPWSIAMVPVLNVDLFELSNNHVWNTEFGFPQWTLPAAGKYMNLQIDEKGFTEWGWIDFGFQTYYALLNCGFRLRPTAGTAAGVHPVPFGFGRVYVQPSGVFNYENWMKGLNAGRSFVTTGPILFIRANGVEVGTTNGPVSKVRITGIVQGLAAIEQVEVIVNGKIAKTITPPAAIESGIYKSKLDITVPIDGTSWVAVRAFEKNNGRKNRFAHTSPIYFDDPKKPLHPSREEIDYLIGRVKEEIVRNQNILMPEALQEYKSALSKYEAIGKTD